MSAALRILHCPENTGAHPQGVAAAERELGLASWAVAFHSGPFGYRTDEVLWADEPNLVVREARRLRLIRRALRDFDVVHFNFGLTLTPPWVPRTAAPQAEADARLRRLWRMYTRVIEQRDLPLLKRAGKGIVVTFQGDDARQGDILRRFALSHVDEVSPSYYPPGSDEHKRVRIARFARWADRIYALNPDLLHVLPPSAHFLPYAHVDPRDWLPVPPQKGTVLRVVHAPTHRAVKGTHYVVEAVERLRSEGVAIELTLIEGMTRDEARRIYEQADLVVDQLLVGWYGGLAVELMALGKPVVCYLRPEDVLLVPMEMREQIPVIDADPSTVYDVLKRLASASGEELAELGNRGRDYVERWHHPLRVAERLKRDYETIASRDAADLVDAGSRLG